MTQKHPTIREIRELLHDIAELAKTPPTERDQAVVDELLARKRSMIERIEAVERERREALERGDWIDSGSGPGWSRSRRTSS